MDNKFFSDLERAVIGRNPVAFERLQPGLSVAEIQQQLNRGGVVGDFHPLLNFFSWRNGSKPSDKSLSETSLFPHSVFQFLPLDIGIGHFCRFTITAEVTRGIEPLFSRLSDIATRYFPIFWDSGHGYLAVDLQASSDGRIVLLEFESDDPLRQAYGSLDAFLEDAIRANVANEPLLCFRISR